MKNILILVNDGFEEVETITPYDMLKRVGCNVVLGSFKGEIKGAHNLNVKADLVINWDNYKNFDYVILPGGPEYKFNKTSDLYKEIIKFYISTKGLACICATPTILGEMGLLKGKDYTCFTPMNNNFGGNFTNASSTTSGNLVTGRSAGCALDFSYSIVKYLFGEEKVKELKEDIIY
ncbi:MAG: DJ-1/PfpI family protein [Acholeplasmatales bacterium]|nr:DJ-1/PfpI family protein [Acholeplasmatales bacterium]